MFKLYHNIEYERRKFFLNLSIFYLINKENEISKKGCNRSGTSWMRGLNGNILIMITLSYAENFLTTINLEERLKMKKKIDELVLT